MNIILKKCTKCGLEQPTMNFHRDKTRKDNLFPQCKTCTGTDKKVHYQNNREEILKQFKNNYSQNRNLILGRNKLWKEHNPEYNSQYYQQNKQEILEARHRHYMVNKEVLNEQTRIRSLTKRHKDPLYKLTFILRNRLRDALQAKSWQKNTHFAEYIGCTLSELKQHLESQFKLGMSWDNYGKGKDKWNIDHIIPLSSAKTKEELYKLCHYTNLQPLWEVDNLKKSNKIGII